MHSDPQDTTPQMTRLPVILTMSRLKVLSITPIHHHYSRDNCGTNLWSVRQDSNLRARAHFVRSEGHQSSLARTLKTLVGELRIELSPRAPKARMQRITLFPVVPAQRVERCSLRFQRSVSTAHTRLAKSGGRWELNPPDYPACKAGDHPK